MKNILLLALLLATVSSNAQQAMVPNQTPGTVANRLVKLNASGAAVITATTDTAGIEGPCVAACGTTGNAIIAKSGLALCWPSMDLRQPVITFSKVRRQ